MRSFSAGGVLREVAALDERLRGPGPGPPPLDHGLAAACLARLVQKVLERRREQRPPGRAAFKASDCVHWLEALRADRWISTSLFAQQP
jgi:hypothetical protein